MKEREEHIYGRADVVVAVSKEDRDAFASLASSYHQRVHEDYRPQNVSKPRTLPKPSNIQAALVHMKKGKTNFSLLATPIKLLRKVWRGS
jgi:hypothetical protein